MVLRKLGTVRRNSDDDLDYVWIPPGEFLMGCSPGDGKCHGDEGEKPHAVRITKGFWLGQTEVTVEAYRRFADSTAKVAMPSAPGFDSGWSDAEQPIVSVTWQDAKTYCEDWAKGRLPTEAEWEYAARAGSTGARYGDLDSIAWYDANSGSKAHPVSERGECVAALRHAGQCLGVGCRRVPE